jgi:hypothetical protein
MEASPLRHVCGQKRLKEASVIGDSQVQQLMGNDELLEVWLLVGEIKRQSESTLRRA